jgi:hypothetical protein
VELVGLQTEVFRFSNIVLGSCCCYSAGIIPLLLSTLSSGTFSFQFSGLKHGTYLLIKFSKSTAKRGGDLRENIQSDVRMHAELRKAMPVR